jgi:hypothetical protein
MAMARSFAGHGGDSITAMQASSLIKRTQNLVVGVKDILTCPTLAEVASRIPDGDWPKTGNAMRFWR